METNYSRRKIAGIFISILIAVYMLFFFPKHIRDDSDGFTATCTVTKAYTAERGGTVSGANDINPRVFLRRRSAALSRCLRHRKVARFPSTLRLLNLAKNIYSMLQTHRLEKTGIL